MSMVNGMVSPLGHSITRLPAGRNRHQIDASDHPVAQVTENVAQVRRSASFSPTITNYGDVKVDLSAPRARRLLRTLARCLALGQRLVRMAGKYLAALEGVGMPDSDLGLLRLQTRM